MSIMKLRKQLDYKEIGALELTKKYLDRIDKVDKQINSYITVSKEEAILSAIRAQEMIDSGKSMPLTGIPISIKDNICTMDVRTTCASKMLENFTPIYDATVISKLKQQGAIILGKTNMDEFAMGNTSQTSYFGCVKNPYNTKYVAGGSSGGAAASVSADLCMAALGTDTGGSLRQPASFCGVTGIKPTYGAVSRYGLIALASSFDQIGVIGKSAIDTGYVLNAISGYDKNDATISRQQFGDVNSFVGEDISNLKIGVVKEFFSDEIDEDVKDSVMGAVKFYESIGCEIVEVSMPSFEYALSAYYIISSAEASSNLSRYDGIRYGYQSKNGDSFNDNIITTRNEGFGDDVKRRILLGNYALSKEYYDTYYKNATRICTQIKREYDKIFSECDIIITPTAPTAAYKIENGQKDIVKTYNGDICTVTVNIAGLPAISTTCGYTKDNMPIGMSIVGKAFDEKVIINAAYIFEKEFKRQEVVI